MPKTDPVQDNAYYTERLPDGRIAMFRGTPPARKPLNRNAQARWDGMHMITLSCRAPVDLAGSFERACKATGVTVYRAIKDFVEAYSAQYDPKTAQNEPGTESS